MSFLKGFSSIGDSTLTNHIRENLISFFDYGLMEKNNIINVDIPSTGVYGDLYHKLKLVNDPRYSYGQVWEGIRSNWVWESGLGAYTSNNSAYPGVSGVYINNSFYPSSETGVYSHYINHYLGRVIFNSPISTASNVECRYSYKLVNVCQANGLNWFKEIQKRSEVNNSGENSVLSDNRYQLPIIGVETSNVRSMKPFQLGGGQTVFTDFILYCVAEDSYTRDNLVDIVTMQNQKVVKSYDLNLVSSGSAFPVDYRGVPVSGAMTYPELVTNFPGTDIRIINSRFDSIYSLTPDIHVGAVKITTECILFGV